jgi:hypothetical protein
MEPTIFEKGMKELIDLFEFPVEDVESDRNQLLTDI